MRLETLHPAGVATFQQYGVCDATTPADDALEAMLADESIQEIHAYTPLNFTRRHKITRSNLRFDFHNHLITAKGIEHAPKNDPLLCGLSLSRNPRGKTYHKDLDAAPKGTVRCL